MDHATLVKKAVMWLGSSAGCTACGSEFTSWGCAESPDAIGWDYLGNCTVIECKTSRSDFLADKKKLFRSGHQSGLGKYRYFMVPQGLVKPEEIPAGWGLIEIKPSGGAVRRSKSLTMIDRNILGENVILVQIARSIRMPEYVEKHNVRTKIKHWVS